MIDIQHISKSYSTGNIEFKALKDVSFHIDDGEYVAIMGPSGSGKSTLMHILGALDTPTTGTYKLDNKDISLYSEEELSEIRKQNIGFVFQAFNLLPRTTLVRNVALPLVYANIPKDIRNEKAKKALTLVGIKETHHNHLSNQISGGQMQRVAIARALINNPSLILADEPTGNLDTKTGELILETFQRLNTEGHTIILITHEPEVAAYAKRTIHLRDGLILSDTKN